MNKYDWEGRLESYEYGIPLKPRETLLGRWWRMVGRWRGLLWITAAVLVFWLAVALALAL